MKDLNEWIAGLRAHRDDLARELARVDRALAVLAEEDAEDAEVTPGRRQGSRESASKTYDTLRAIMELTPNKHYTAEDALEVLRQQGWETEATDPVNALRTALSRMAKRGEISRVGRGEYAYVVPEAAAVDNADTKPEPEPDPWDSPPSSDPWEKPDPWASSSTGGSDEPPF